jgi:hypothetical protein
MVFHQSWLNTFQKCPEQARLSMRGELPRVETDATAIGTSLHAAIEHALLMGADYDECLNEALLKFLELSELPHFEWKQVATMATAQRYIANCFTAFYRWVLPTLGEPLSIERYFKVPLDEYRGYKVMLAGTWDVEFHDSLKDWKTAGRPYEAWEVDRWYIQPTAYAYAHSVLRGGPMPAFEYIVHLKGATVQPPQRLLVQRHEGHVEWLRQQLRRIIDLYEATEHGERAWPLMDQSWHCSPKWCSVYSECKGAALESHLTLTGRKTL